MAGLSSAGLTIKRANDIRQELVEAYKTKFGQGINTQSEAPLGQEIDIKTERLSLIWELLDAIYAAFDPDKAEGAALDRVCALVGVVRKAATYSTAVARCYGTPTTIVPSGTQFQVSGDEDAIFETNADGTIASAVNEKQTISFSEVPTGGIWNITFDGETTAALAFGDVAATIETALEALTSIGAGNVSVSGDYTNGFVIEFVSGLAGQELDAVTITNNLTGAGSVTVAVEETQGGGAYIDIDVTATVTGAIVANANSLTEILTPVSGLDSVTNKEDAETGSAIESDATLRLRRKTELSTAASATLEAIISQVSAVADVTQVAGFENVDQDPVDGDGRPIHSFEIVVKGGTNQDIADEIWQVKGGGIETFGSETETVTDSQGITHDISFSRPTELDMYVIANITKETGTTISSDDVKASIIEYGDALNMGDDVLPAADMIPEITADVDNIRNIELLVGVVNPPTTSTPITVAASELAVFDTSRITVNIS